MNGADRRCERSERPERIEEPASEDPELAADCMSERSEEASSTTAPWLVRRDPDPALRDEDEVEPLDPPPPRPDGAGAAERELDRLEEADLDPPPLLELILSRIPLSSASVPYDLSRLRTGLWCG